MTSTLLGWGKLIHSMIVRCVTKRELQPQLNEGIWTSQEGCVYQQIHIYAVQGQVVVT